MYGGSLATASFHAQVHMIYEGRFTEQWGSSEPITCKLTFIGKNLDHDGLRSGFEDCLANEANYDKLKKSFRSSFEVPGAAVSAAPEDVEGSCWPEEPAHVLSPKRSPDVFETFSGPEVDAKKSAESGILL